MGISKVFDSYLSGKGGERGVDGIISDLNDRKPARRPLNARRTLTARVAVRGLMR